MSLWDRSAWCCATCKWWQGERKLIKLEQNHLLVKSNCPGAHRGLKEDSAMRETAPDDYCKGHLSLAGGELTEKERPEKRAEIQNIIEDLLAALAEGSMSRDEAVEKLGSENIDLLLASDLALDDEEPVGWGFPLTRFSASGRLALSFEVAEKYVACGQEVIIALAHPKENDLFRAAFASSGACKIPRRKWTISCCR